MLFVTTPSGDKVQFDVQEGDTLLDVRRMMVDVPSTACLVSFRFRSDESTFSDYNQFNDLPEEGLELKIEPLPYTQADILRHIKRVENVLSRPPCLARSSQWVEGLSAQEEIISIKDSTIPSIEEVFSMQRKSKFSEFLSSMETSRWDPPNAQRQLRGDLVYIRVSTIEGQVFHITGTPNGFFVNKSTDSLFNPEKDGKFALEHNLTILLKSLSKGFDMRFSNFLTDQNGDHPFVSVEPLFPAHEWIVGNNSIVSRAVDTKMEEPPRSWNKEFRQLKDDPLSRQYIRGEFAEYSYLGVKRITKGHVLPLNPSEEPEKHVWCIGDVFFSRANDSNGMFSDCGGAFAHRKSVIHEYRGSQMIYQLGVDGLHTVMSSLVELMGELWICQAVIPGILGDEQFSSMKFGALDDGKWIQADENLRLKIEAVSEALGFSNRKAKTASGDIIQLNCPVETKGIVGNDGEYYILEYTRTLPRDANYPEFKDCTRLLRPEFVSAFKRHKALQLILNENEIKPSEIPDEMLLKKIKGIRFNCNAFTKYEEISKHFKKDKDLLFEAASFLEEKVMKEIPNYLIQNPPIDGDTLAIQCHAHGINMRYIGRIADLVKEDKLVYRLLIRDIVIRSAKHLLREELRLSDEYDIASVVAKFLSSVVRPGQPAEHIKTEAKQYFQSDLEDVVLEEEDCFRILRGICRSVGIQLRSREYDFKCTCPVFVDDVLGINPLMQDIPLEIDVSPLMKEGFSHLNDAYMNKAHTAFSEAIGILSQTTGFMHVYTADCYSAMSVIMQGSENLPLAIDYQMRALLIAEKVRGSDSWLSVLYRNRLAQLYLALGMPKFAYEHCRQSLLALELIVGIGHPETAATLSNLGYIVQKLGDSSKAAVLFESSSAALKDCCHGKHSHIDFVRRNQAVCYYHNGRYKEAIALLKDQRQRLTELVGVSHAAVGECNDMILVFVKCAISQTSGGDIPVLEESKQRIEWIPNSITPSIMGMECSVFMDMAKSLDAIRKLSE